MVRFGLLLILLLLSVACTGAPSVVLVPTLTPAPLPEAGSGVSDAPAPKATPAPTVVLSTSTPPPTLIPLPAAELSPPSGIGLVPTPVLHRFEDFNLVPGRVVDLVDEGTVLFDLGRYDEAIAKFEETEREHGEPLGEAQNRVGLSYQRMGDYGLAIDHFTRAIAAGDRVAARINRDTIGYRDSNQCTGAVQDALVVLKMEPVWSRVTIPMWRLIRPWLAVLPGWRTLVIDDNKECLRIASQ